MSIGQVNVKLGLDAAEYVQGLTKAQLQARKFGEQFGDSIRTGAAVATGAFAAVSAAGVAAFAFIKNQADAVDAFNDLADASGASVESISALDRIARETGGSFATAEAVLLKFNTALASAKPDNDAGRLLKAMNLDIEKLKGLDPAESLRQTAVAFARFENDGNKARAMQELFGKSVKEAAPFLNDLAEKTALVGTTSTTTAQQAELFNKQVANLQANSTDAARAIVADLLPSMNRLLENFTKIREQGNLGLVFKDAAKDLFGLGQLSSNPAEDINNLIAARERLRKDLSFAETKGFPTRDITASINENARLLELSRTRQASAVNQSQIGADTSDAQSRRMGGGKLSLVLPAATTKTTGSADDPFKKLLDNELKALDRIVSQQSEVMASRNRMLEMYNSQGLLSIKDYYEGQRVAMDEATAAQAKSYDDQIALLKNAQSKTGKKTDQAEMEGKINDLIEKRRKLMQEAGLAQIESNAKQGQAFIEMQRSADEVNAKSLEFKGNLEAAAAIRFDAQYDKLRTMFSNNGRTDLVQQIDDLRKIEINQAAINKVTQDFNVIIGDLQAAEQRIAQDRENGAVGEITALQQTGEARRSYLGLLDEQIAKLDTIRTMGELTPEQKQFIDRLTNTSTELQAKADPLASMINKDVNAAAADFFTNMTSGAKTAREAIDDFGKSVFNSFNKVISQQLGDQLVRSLFGPTGKDGGGGIGGWLSNLLGGGGASSGGSNIFSSIGGFVSKFFGFAGGGIAEAGSIHRVNENGPEMLDYQGKQYLMMGDRAGRITPNGGGGNVAQTINFHVQGAVDSRTQGQIASTVYRATQRATARGTA